MKIPLPRYLQLVVASVILSSLSVAGDTPGINANSDRVSTAPPYEDRRGAQADGLETRRPYERGKVPVVLIHGLWGKPNLWDRMIEDLEAEAALGSRYQFWTFRYASGDSIPYSAHLLRHTLRQAPAFRSHRH